MGWATIAVMFISSFTLLGILAIAGEIENPFGYDNNDLELDSYCNQLKIELVQIMDRPSKLDVGCWSIASAM